MLKVRTSDDQTFEVEEHLAIKSETLKFIVDDDVVGDVIPLPNVDGPTMAKIIEWWKEQFDQDGNPTDELKSWEAKFLDVDTDTLYDLLMAANYLNINDLLHKICRKVADLIKGKSVTAIRELFNIPSDFTPEEEAEIRKNNSWAFQ
ncbi:hypothetical protein K2173_009640 [Erythroxylum novogranatense]|uniref:SKP1-like protein n=1 Tax=Erythroxylum novogranatense TaxID=1862640 RepID=A0AAV8U7Z3_9ROSI|nr:hypothetical protein K2173_009640 [Erythroxylum novogranatense]